MPTFYFFYLEIALRKSKDPSIYAFENISHIPTKKIVDLFAIDLTKDPHLLEGYYLTKKLFKKHKKYIHKNIGQINLKVFEYCLNIYVAEDFSSVRKMYKEDIME